MYVAVIPNRSSPCTAPGFLDTRLLLSGGLHDRLVPGCSGITGTTQSVLFDEPLGVVAGDEVANGVADLVDGLVDSARPGCRPSPAAWPTPCDVPRPARATGRDRRGSPPTGPRRTPSASVHDGAPEFASPSCRPGAGRHRRTIAARPRFGRPGRCRSGGRWSGKSPSPLPRSPAAQRSYGAGGEGLAPLSLDEANGCAP